MAVAANVSFLFTDAPFAERVDRAARAGFPAVEFAWPGGEALTEVGRRAAAAGVRVAMFNLDAGDMAAGERGVVNDPDRVDRFLADAPAALERAAELGCPRVNVLVGLERDGEPRASQLARARDAVERVAALAEPLRLEVLIESINLIDNGPYLLPTAADAERFLDDVAAPNASLQFDVYHVARSGDDPVAALRAALPRVGHVQVADAPGRHEPGTGHLDLDGVLDVLAAGGYAGDIGMEYVPSPGATEDNLGWLAEWRARCD